VIRVVLDTNVVVSGLLSPKGPPGRIVDFLTNDLIQVFYSDEILLEYADVLRRRELRILPDIVDALLRDIQGRGTIIAAAPWPVPVPDSSDSVFLAVAAAAHATVVTGNIKHYPAVARLGVEVLSPRAFIDQHDAEIATLFQERVMKPK
jgi:putative PIN family toxin of toxin-antitoxin system